MQTSNQRNPIFSGFLSLIFGPFGYIYIGLNFMISGFIILIIFNLILTSINYPLQNYWLYLQLILFADYGYKLAKLKNVFTKELDSTLTDVEIKEFKSFGFSFIRMIFLLKRLLQFYSILYCFFLANEYFEQGKYFAVILILILGVKLITWVISYIFIFVISVFFMLLFNADETSLIRVDESKIFE